MGNGASDAGPPELTPTELLAVTTIAYLQPATRGELSRLVGKEVSRDIIGRLKSLDLIAAGPRAPEPGAPYAYVTTRKFLEVFGLASLRDLPDIEKLEDAGSLQRPEPEIDLDEVLGIREDDAELMNEIETKIDKEYHSSPAILKNSLVDETRQGAKAPAAPHDISFVKQFLAG